MVCVRSLDKETPEFAPFSVEHTELERDAQKRLHRVQAVILAGTELPLLLRAESVEGLPLLDTTQIHVNAAVSEMLSG